jgi:hypothetical protein
MVVVERLALSIGLLLNAPQAFASTLRHTTVASAELASAILSEYAPEAYALTDFATKRKIGSDGGGCSPIHDALNIVAFLLAYVADKIGKIIPHHSLSCGTLFNGRFPRHLQKTKSRV